MATQAYDRDRQCVKCGEKSAQTEYDANSDEMKRTCGRCKYQWTELPLDRTQG